MINKFKNWKYGLNFKADMHFFFLSNVNIPSYNRQILKAGYTVEISKAANSLLFFKIIICQNVTSDYLKKQAKTLFSLK